MESSGLTGERFQAQRIDHQLAQAHSISSAVRFCGSPAGTAHPFAHRHGRGNRSWRDEYGSREMLHRAGIPRGVGSGAIDFVSRRAVLAILLGVGNRPRILGARILLRHVGAHADAPPEERASAEDVVSSTID